MYIKFKHVKDLGFQGVGMFSNSLSYLHYYHRNKKLRQIICISNSTPQNISVFDLSKKEWQQFMGGKLSLLPPGCCCVTGHQTINPNRILFWGTIKSKKHLNSLISASKILGDVGDVNID